MKRSSMALLGVLILLAACGSGRNDTPRAGASVEDTSAAPTADAGTPTKDTVADTGSGEVRMRPHDGPMVPSRSDSVDKTAGSP